LVSVLTYQALLSRFLTILQAADAESSQLPLQRRSNGSAPLQEPLPLLAENGPRGLTAADVLAAEGDFLQH
jgi:hypothetical protein